MKNNLLFFLIASVVFVAGAGCSDPKTQPDFQMSLECGKFREKAEKYVDAKNPIDALAFVESYEFDSIFYSSKLNTCLVEYHSVINSKDASGEYVQGRQDWLEDFLTGNIIGSDKNNVNDTTENKVRYEYEWREWVNDYR